MRYAEERATSPLRATGRWYTIAMLVLVVLTLLMVYSTYLMGPGNGTGGTGVDDAAWGVYRDTFVAFVGLALGGVLVSGLLRASNAQWGEGLARVAEAIVVPAVLIALVAVVLDVGDLVKVMDALFHGQITNPLVWDGVLVAVLLVVGSAILYFSLVPDLHKSALRVRRWQWLYRILAYGYAGTSRQRTKLARIVRTVALVSLVLVLVLVTAVAWTLDGIEPMEAWHLAVTGPYFITAALLSGFALAAGGVAVLHRAMGDRTADGGDAFPSIARALMVLAILHLVVYVAAITVAEYETASGTVSLTEDLWSGRYTFITWAFLITGLIAPIVITGLPRLQNPRGVLAASGMVLGTMWLRTYMVALPGLSHHLAPAEGGVNIFSWEEWAFAVGAMAFFLLMLGMMFKIIPFVSIEFRDGHGRRRVGAERGTPLYDMMFTTWVPTMTALFAGVVAWVAISAWDPPSPSPDGLGGFPSPFFVIALTTVLTLLVSFIASFFRTKGWTAFAILLVLILAYVVIELLDWVVGTWGSRMVLLGVAAVLGVVVGLVLFLLFIKRIEVGVWAVGGLLVLYAVLTLVSIELEAPNMFLGVFLFNVMVVLTLVGYKLIVTFYTWYKKYTLGA